MRRSFDWPCLKAKGAICALVIEWLGEKAVRAAHGAPTYLRQPDARRHAVRLRPALALVPRHPVLELPRRARPRESSAACAVGLPRVQQAR
eukprot:5643058-Alexandrium_andersonii.AAC.1